MKLSIDKITPHPKNREIYSLSDLDDLKSSLQTVGLLQPLILNQFNQILSGHRRFECIKELGWEEVEVDIKTIMMKIPNYTSFTSTNNELRQLKKFFGSMM